MLEIRQATSAADFRAVRTLVASFIDWLTVRFADGTALIDEYFQAIQPELAGLPGAYGPPAGCLLLACLDGLPVGTVALRDLGEGSCEMKRLFVNGAVQVHGAGRALAQTLVREAARMGYARMQLDTSRRQAAAIGLYRGLGFREIAPCYDASALLRETMVFMELSPPRRPAGPDPNPSYRVTGQQSRLESGLPELPEEEAVDIRPLVLARALKLPGLSI